MNTISQAVRQIIQADLRILDAIRMGIVNNRKLAKLIQEDVSKTAGQNAGISTIAVTLQRLGAKIKATSDNRYANIFRNSRLQLMDDITVLYMMGSTQKLTPDVQPPGFYVRIQGIATTTIFIDDASADCLEYKKDDLLKRISDLSVIIITSPSEIVETPGVIAQLMMVLGSAGINVVEVTSSYNNTYLLVRKKDSLPAVEAVRNIIGHANK